MDLISPLELQFGKAEEGGSIDDVHISDGSNICSEKESAYLRLQLLLTMELLRMFWLLLFEMFDIIKKYFYLLHLFQGWNSRNKYISMIYYIINNIKNFLFFTQV